MRVFNHDSAFRCVDLLNSNFVYISVSLLSLFYGRIVQKPVDVAKDSFSLHDIKVLCADFCRKVHNFVYLYSNNAFKKRIETYNHLDRKIHSRLSGPTINLSCQVLSLNHVLYATSTRLLNTFRDEDFTTFLGSLLDYSVCEEIIPNK